MIDDGAGCDVASGYTFDRACDRVESLCRLCIAEIDKEANMPIGEQGTIKLTCFENKNSGKD